MTLASTPAYRASDVRARPGGPAIVVGGSIAGLLGARILADAYGDVIVFERDRLPQKPVDRRSVAQSDQPHVLLEGGRQTLDALFDGFTDDLLDAGAATFDVGDTGTVYANGGTLDNGSAKLTVYSATRPLVEYLIRERIQDDPRIELRTGKHVTDYLTESSRGEVAVTGVTAIDSNHITTECGGELVVDATGARSHLPNWFEKVTGHKPQAETINVDTVYATGTVYRPDDDARAYEIKPSGNAEYGSYVLPVEDNRWMVMLNGMNGTRPPASWDEFTEATRELPLDDIYQIVDSHSKVSDSVKRFPFSQSIRWRYDLLESKPKNIIALGDSLMNLNPMYGQGMTSAAFQALALHGVLREGHLNIEDKYFDTAIKAVDAAWKMAAILDHRYEGVSGDFPQGVRLGGWYLSRLVRQAQRDGELLEPFFRVQMMEKRPTSLLAPKVLWKVLKPALAAGNAF